jgi:ubiquinone/menaquinone biosynthesis C-methylase UbiE
MKLEKQVGKSVYSFERYTKVDRWSSYFYQLREILSKSPSSVLEVGVGDGVIRDYLLNHTKIDYKSLNIAEDLKPDMVGSVTNISLLDNSFDLVCAFEILEHLPFSSFDKSVSELFRVSKSFVIISLPHFGPPVFFDFKFPLLPRIRFAFKILFPLKHVFNGQHYWEIGKRGYPTKRIKSVLKKYGNLVSEFVPSENQYHHFFILKKK